MSILSLFYRWAIDEGMRPPSRHLRSARALFAGTGRDVKVNLAVRVCRAKKGRCWEGHLYKVPVPVDNPVWYEWVDPNIWKGKD